jgi:hypothetical protein
MDEYITITISKHPGWWEEICDSITYLTKFQYALGLKPERILCQLRNEILDHIEAQKILRRKEQEKKE